MVDVIVSTPNSAGKWTDADLAAIFGRAVVSRLLANELTPNQAFQQARLAGSYGLRALRLRAIYDFPKRRALAHQETVADGFAAIQGAFGEGR